MNVIRAVKTVKIILPGLIFVASGIGLYALLCLALGISVTPLLAEESTDQGLCVSPLNLSTVGQIEWKSLVPGKSLHDNAVFAWNREKLYVRDDTVGGTLFVTLSPRDKPRNKLDAVLLLNNRKKNWLIFTQPANGAGIRTMGQSYVTGPWSGSGGTTMEVPVMLVVSYEHR